MEIGELAQRTIQGSLDMIGQLYRQGSSTRPAKEVTSASRRYAQSKAEKEFKTHMVASRLIPPELSINITNKTATAVENPSVESLKAVVEQVDRAIELLPEDAKDAKNLYTQHRNMFDL